MKVGDTIQTVYGTGKLVSYRELNNVYELDLPFGKLYANQTTVLHGKESEVPKQNRSMEINVAYEALEKMRRLNLEVTCQEHGIFNVDFDKCVTCLLTEANEVATVQNARFPRLRNLVDQTKKLKPKRMSPPCLICGSPVCADHSSKSFRAEKINVCLDCEKLFNFEYIVDCLTTEKKERRERIDRMIDLYDRTALLLKYSAQYIDGVAESLEQAMTRQNKIGVGGSTAGIMSGALGIAAAATILTPAGPPLLIASLLFGGSATAVQTGTEVKNRYFSEPHQLAGNIIALHGMLRNILKVAGILRDAVARHKLTKEDFEGNFEKSQISEKVTKVFEKNRGGLLGALTAGRFGAAGMEVGQIATAAEASATGARNARFFSRTGSNILKTARVARFAGGAISAATLLLEAKCMSDTIKAIKAGNPCDKAKSLRKIKEEISTFPSTAELDQECERYLEVMDCRDRALSEQEAIRLLLEVAEESQENNKEQLIEQSAGELILQGEEPSYPDASPPNNEIVSSSQSAFTGSATDAGSRSKSLSGSLLQRIQQFKDQEAAADSRSD